MPAAIVFAVNYLAVAGAISVGTAVAIGTFVATYGTALLFVGAMAYSSYKQKQAKEDAKTAYNASQIDRTVNVSSAVAPRELVLGRVRKGGAVFYKASTGANSRDFYLAIALAGHEVDAVEAYYLNDQLVTVDASGYVLEAPYNTTATKSGTLSTGAGTTATLPANYVPGSVYATWWGYDPALGGTDNTNNPTSVSVSGLVATAGHVGATISYQYTEVSSAARVFFHSGAPGQVADAALRAAFPADWLAANVVQGVAYVVWKFSYSESAFPNGVPAATAVIRGAKVYDPRTGLTSWSDNPALLIRHVYTHADFGKAACTAAEDARFVAAANACDTSTAYVVDGVTDVQKLYRASLVGAYGTAAKSLLDDLAQAMGGSWAHQGGEIYLKAGVYTAPVMALGEADLATIQRDGASETQRPLSIGVHKARADKFNTVKTQIWDHDQDYKQVSLTSLVGAALKARDGAELVQEITMPAVGYAPQALHIAGIVMRDARDPMTIEMALKLVAYPLEIFDNVTLTLPRYGFAAKVFMLLSRSWAADGTLMLTFKETTAAITQLDAGFAAQGFAKNTNLPKPWEVAAVGPLTVESGTATLVKQADGTVTSRARVTFPQIVDAAVIQGGKIEIQMRQQASSGAWETISADGGDTSATFANVTDGEVYLFRARGRTSTGVGDWCAQVVHQIVGKTEPPPAFDYFSVMAQPDGTRQYNFGYSSIAAQPVDWMGAEIRYTSGSVASPDWDLMTPLQDATTYYTSSPVELNAPLSGVWTFSCKSLDTSGNASTYRVVSLTLPDRRLGNVFDEFYEGADGWVGSLTDCHMEGGYPTANDSTTWATLPATWAGWTRWIMSPSSPIIYTSPLRDFGVVIAGQINATLDADGSTLVEMAASADGATWSAWGSAAAAFSTRYLRVRLTVTATGPYPVPVIRQFDYTINSPMRTEYLNDVVVSGLAGAYRIGVGDIRIPLAGTYTLLKRISVVIQDGSAGSWTWTRADSTLSPTPRIQFKLNGVLADPAFVDFFIEGY